MNFVPLAAARTCGRKIRFVFWCLALLLAVTAAEAASRRELRGHVPAAVARLSPGKQFPATNQLNLAIGLPLRNTNELDALLRDLYDPANPNYRHYLTPEEFTQQFGPTVVDYQVVLDFARTNGLTVTATHPNRVVLDVQGSVAAIQNAFHITLRTYSHPTEGREFYAPDTEPSVDSSVSVLHISGLDNYSLPHPNSKMKPLNRTPQATPNAGSGPSGTYRGGDFRAAYVPGTALTGAGQSVGLLQFDGYYASDIAAYASQAGLTSIPLVNVAINGGVATPGTGNGEVCLDIEMVMSMAPGVSKIYVYEAPNPSPWVDLFNRMVTNTAVKQFSCSWGGGSPDPTSEGIFKQMAAQGQSFFNATGDSDAFTNAISFPSDSTNITQVGGTTLTTTGAGGAYVSETAWNWNNGTGSSGGVSTYYGIPNYQQGISMTANLGSTTMRNVPDVALTADNVYVTYNNGGTGTFGGTSCAAPLWAGFMALVNQQAASGGKPSAGFINPAVYAIGKSNANYAAIFHDITTGNNFNAGSPAKYPAVAGYDLCTGWGTPAGANLINLLAPLGNNPVIALTAFSLAAENCAPPNGVIDPGETVTVNLSLQNTGTANTTNLIVTLLATNGVTAPSAAQTYGGVITNGTAVTQPFTFTANGSCGGTITPTFHLQDGTNDLGYLNQTITLGQTATLWSENFDGSTAPALPAGWATIGGGGQAAWVNSTVASDTAPNAMFSMNATSVGTNELDSPAITLPSGAAQLTFRQNYDLESGYDGGVLEIKIGAGAWTDIVTAGGSFATGGYISALSTSYGNPLGGRSAWTGTSGGFITTTVNLPASAAGQSVQFRWRCGTDSSNAGAGWYVDSVAISGYACCAGASAPVIITQPQSQTILAGNPVNFFVNAVGTAPIGYQWYFNSNLITGATATNYTITSVQASNTGNYTVVLTNAVGTTNSSVATLTLGTAPAITTDPVSLTVTAGNPASFTATATGSAPLAYQWRFNGTNISGATTSTYAKAGAQFSDSGSYTLVVTNFFGAATSAPAALTVTGVVSGILAGWDVSGQTSFGTSPLKPTTNLAYLTIVGLTRGTGVLTSATSPASGGWGGNGFTSASEAAAITASDFATFSIAANAGYKVTFTSIPVFAYRRQSSGPTSGALQYQIGAGAFTDITTVAYSSTSSSGATLSAIDLSGIPALQNVPAGTNVTFRIVNWGASGSTGKWYIYNTAGTTAPDFAVQGSVAPVILPPAVAPALAALAATNNQFQFMITGTAGSNYIVQYSTNLAAGSWIPLQTSAAPFLFIESNASSLPQRFYRGQIAP